MKLYNIYQEFEILSEKIGIRVIKDKGNFVGGYCKILKEEVIVLNKNNPIEQKIKQLALVFSKIDIDNTYIKPKIREIINNYT